MDRQNDVVIVLVWIGMSDVDYVDRTIATKVLLSKSWRASFVSGVYTKRCT